MMSDTGDGRRVVYDVVVIGAGVIGSAAAYHIVRKGVRVALIEQVRCTVCSFGVSFQCYR